MKPSGDKDDQGPTPRTDARIAEILATPSDGNARIGWLQDFARQLERELAEAQKIAADLIVEKRTGEWDRYLSRPSLATTTDAVSLTVLALDRMVESVQEELRANDPMNKFGFTFLTGELKGLMASRTYLQAATAAELRSLAPSPRVTTEPVLDKPAQVGATRFGIGIKWSTVIDRAQREWDYFKGLKNPRSSDIDADPAPLSPLSHTETIRGACHDAAERDEGCFRAVRAERLLKEAQERLSTPATLTDAQIAAIGGEPRNVLDVMGSDPAPRAMNIPVAAPTVLSSTAALTAEDVITALRELADGYAYIHGCKTELSVGGRTRRESIIAQELARLSTLAVSARLPTKED